MKNVATLLRSGLLWLAPCLCACISSAPVIPEPPPQTGLEFLGRLAEIAEHGWEVAPDQVASILGTTFVQTPRSPSTQSTTCAAGRLVEGSFAPRPGFWFRRILPSGPDRTAPPGSLQARFIPRDPIFTYSTYVLDDCHLRADISFHDVDSWACISVNEVKNAGYAWNLSSMPLLSLVKRLNMIIPQRR